VNRRAVLVQSDSVGRSLKFGKRRKRDTWVKKEKRPINFGSEDTKSQQTKSYPPKISGWEEKGGNKERREKGKKKK